MPTYRIDNKFFSGAKAVHDGILADALRQLAINDARRVMVTANVAAITDNGGGAAANGTVEAIPIPAAFTEVGTASAPKAGFETALGLIKDGITELAAKTVALAAVVPAVDVIDNSGGTAADGTIALLTQSVTATAASIASYTGTVTVATGIRNAFATLTAAVNKLRAAVGLTPIVDASGGTVLYPNTIPAISTNTGTAVDGTALSGISKAGADAFLAASAHAIKELSTAINAVRAQTAPAAASVVAV